MKHVLEFLPAFIKDISNELTQDERGVRAALLATESLSGGDAPRVNGLHVSVVASEVQ